MKFRSFSPLNKFILTTILLLIIYFAKAQSKNENSVHLESIIELFENRSDSLLEKEHTWTYTYTDRKQTRLYKLYEELSRNKITVEKVQNGGNYYFIKLNENKIYTPELLYERVQKLDSIADKFGIRPIENLGYIIER